jgi:mRNA-degrading endonuclease RelE of RelBE toxin-antitoxin system
VTRGRRSRKNRPAQPESSPEAQPWHVRLFRTVDDDARRIGHAGLAVAKDAILKKLATQPELYGEPLRAPLHPLRKLRVSHLRIVYYIDGDRREVWIVKIADRQEVYEHEAQIMERFEQLKLARASESPHAAPPKPVPKKNARTD